MSSSSKTVLADVYRCSLCGKMGFDVHDGDVHYGCEVHSGEVMVMGGAGGPDGFRGWGKWRGPVGTVERLVPREIQEWVHLDE